MIPLTSDMRPGLPRRRRQRRVEPDVRHARADKDGLLARPDLPVLARRVPVADVTPRQLKLDRPRLARREGDLVEAPQNGERVILAAELDVLKPKLSAYLMRTWGV